MAPRTDEYHHGDLANSLLRAVEEIVLEKSAAELSLREAARRAGVSHSAPAHHFGDKQGLLIAFAAEGFRSLADAMEEASGDPSDPDKTNDQMTAMGRAYVLFAVEHPAHFDVMFRSGLDKSADPELHAQAERAYGLLRAKTEAVLAAGAFPGADAEALSAYFWSVVHGLASLWVDGSMPQFMPDATIEEVFDGVIAVPESMLTERMLTERMLNERKLNEWTLKES